METHRLWCSSLITRHGIVLLAHTLDGKCFEARRRLCSAHCDRCPPCMRDRPPVHRLPCEMVSKGIVDRRNSLLAEVAGPHLLRWNRVQRWLINQIMPSNSPFPLVQQKNAVYLAHFSVLRF
jgi:hypothetical protein